ncbi:hypothetical protein GCM10009789_32960 [Kribbella sancticallisti]|uniref:Uncharacterized protein n=1 Tax=Kribbella sancticallisti TaxID=460087 RepID=A0ABN2DIN0_9ACTN
MRVGEVGFDVVGLGEGLAVADGRGGVVRVGEVLAEGKGTAGWPESVCPPRYTTASPDSTADSSVIAAAAATMTAARVRRFGRPCGSDVMAVSPDLRKPHKRPPGQTNRAGLYN